MKILIAGSRSVQSYDIKQHIDKDVSLIICGGAIGILLLKFWFITGY